MPATLLTLLDEHRHMDRLLLVLEQQSEALRHGNPADIGTVRSIIDYMARYPDRSHHPKEDLILAKIEATNPQLDEIASEIRRAHGLLARKRQELLALVPGCARLSKQAQGDRLRQMLTDYVVLMRRDMHYEESIVFEEAERLLSEEDWHEIEQTFPTVADPIFGERAAPEFEALLVNYLNRATAVAIGQVPIGLFEIGASTAERFTDVGRQIRRLPTGLLSLGRSRALDQARRLQSLLSSRDLITAGSALRGLVGSHLAGPREYYALVRDAVLARERTAAPPVPPSADGTDPASATHTLHPSVWAGVSWQAAALNLTLRTMMKPLFKALDAKRAKQVSNLVARWQRPPAGVQLKQVQDASFRAEWVRPIGLNLATRRTILYLPGGGFFLPATSMHVAMLAKLARMTKARALLVHYRLAPDHPFPAGLDDAVAAYRHLLDSGTPPQDIVIAGDSAGGCLTLSLLLALKQKGLPMPAGGAILSALTDLNFIMPSRTYNRWRDPMLPTGSTSSFFKFYAGETARDNPLVSPIYGDYHGFPPMFAQVGSTEILLDDTLLVARKARLHGADFDVEVWSGMPHVWQMAEFLPESRRALVKINGFFEKAWYRAHNPTAARRRRMENGPAAA